MSDLCISPLDDFCRIGSKCPLSPLGQAEFYLSLFPLDSGLVSLFFTIVPCLDYSFPSLYFFGHFSPYKFLSLFLSYLSMNYEYAKMLENSGFLL